MHELHTVLGCSMRVLLPHEFRANDIKSLKTLWFSRFAVSENENHIIQTISTTTTRRFIMLHRSARALHDLPQPNAIYLNF